MAEKTSEPLDVVSKHFENKSSPINFFSFTNRQYTIS